MAQNTGTFTIEDFDHEISKTQFNVGPITAGNFAAKRAALDDLKNAIIPLILGEIRRTNINETFTESTDLITDENAQRERKWLVTYRDVTQFFDGGNTINNPGFGELSSVEVPTAKAALLLPNSDEIDMTDADVVDFIAAFEAVQNSPTGGNETQVEQIKLVGRNL